MTILAVGASTVLATPVAVTLALGAVAVNLGDRILNRDEK